MTERYALFDPQSGYSALRANFIVPEKLRGYFYWRQADRARQSAGSGEPLVPLVFRGGAPPQRLAASVIVPTEPDLPEEYAIQVGLLNPADHPHQPAPCRAFLVEQAVLARLRAQPALGPSLPADDEAALACLLDHRVLKERFEVQQALSALPELEGRIEPDGKGVLRARIPAGSPNILGRAWVVVVVDEPA
jgi:hypothetical protein